MTTPPQRILVPVDVGPESDAAVAHAAALASALDGELLLLGVVPLPRAGSCDPSAGSGRRGGARGPGGPRHLVAARRDAGPPRVRGAVAQVPALGPRRPCDRRRRAEGTRRSRRRAQATRARPSPKFLA